jgi:hypothetical protein
LFGAFLVALALAPPLSACGDPQLAYVFVDGDHREYKLTMVVAETDADRETLGTVTLEALLRVDVNIDERAPNACFATVDYEDAKIITTGFAQTSGNTIPRAYFHLCGDHLLTFDAPAPRATTTPSSWLGPVPTVR